MCVLSCKDSSFFFNKEMVAGSLKPSWSRRHTARAFQLEKIWSFNFNQVHGFNFFLLVWSSYNWFWVYLILMWDWCRLCKIRVQLVFLRCMWKFVSLCLCIIFDETSAIQLKVQLVYEYWLVLSIKERKRIVNELILYVNNIFWSLWLCNELWVL